jgi:hypothetical protein
MSELSHGESPRRGAGLDGVKVEFTAGGCRCGCAVATVDEALVAHCIGCSARRGSLSLQTAGFLRALIGQFGPPTTPITLRRHHAPQEINSAPTRAE